jgi:hypothetical protein
MIAPVWEGKYKTFVLLYHTIDPKLNPEAAMRNQPVKMLRRVVLLVSVVGLSALWSIAPAQPAPKPLKDVSKDAGDA